jgi:uncharacterized protein (DUF2141 family)
MLLGGAGIITYFFYTLALGLMYGNTHTFKLKLMNRKSLLFLILYLISIPLVAQSEFELKVRVINVPSTKGTMRICITANQTDFMKKCILSKEVAIPGKEVTVAFSGVGKGRYAIAVYHDEDNNGILTKGGLLGIPTEAYGFSNNPRAMFGPPGFDKCAFALESDKEIVIRL